MNRNKIYALLAVIILFAIILIFWQYHPDEKSNENNEINHSLEFDYTLTNNTNIVFPANNSDVSGWIQIITYVELCNCSGYTKLYVDGLFVSNGSHNPDEPMEVLNGQWYEIFHNTLDTAQFSNGQHEIVVIGKHDQYSDRITVNVEN